MSSYVVIVSHPKTFSNKRVEVDSFYKIKYMEYCNGDADDIQRKKLNGIFKLLAKDFTKMEDKYNMPRGTIDEDARVVYAMSLRTRFCAGELILLHYESEMTLESTEEYLNTIPHEEMIELIDKARLRL